MPVGIGAVRRALVSTESPPATVSASALAGLRVLAGLLWLYNLVWKTPPHFGEDNGGGLYSFTRHAVEHPVLPPYSWLVEHLVLPNFTAFAWLVLVVETALAVLLLTGTAVRLACVIGIGQSVAIGLSVAATPGEWPWAYAMLIGIHVVLLFTPSAQYLAVDAMRTTSSAVRLLRGWGMVLGVTGIAAVAVSFQRERFASLGGLLGYQKLELSLGNYNIVGAVALLGVAALMLGAAMTGFRLLGLVAAAVAAASAVSIYAQWGRSEVWLGGTGTSAAVFLCGATVCLATLLIMRTRTEVSG